MTIYSFCRFLFQGDGSAVPTNSQPQSVYDVPRSSLDSHSFQKRSSGNYQNHNSMRSRSQDHDSGYHSVEKTLSILDGPPVRLDKHPSVRRKRDSDASIRSNSIASASSPYGSLEPDLFECDEGSILSTSDSILGHSPADDTESYITGHMDGDSESISYGQRLYDTIDHGRSHSICLAQALHDNEDNQYMQMLNPEKPKEGVYVYMRSSSLGAVSKSSTMPVPMPQTGGGVSSDEYNILQHMHHNGRPVSRQHANSLNYETLPTINESRRGPIPVHGEEKRDGPKNYENHPMPQDLKDIAPRVYRPSYENRDSSTFRGRRGSHGKESYENVGSEHYQRPREVMVEGRNSNGNNNVVKRTTSLRRCGESEEAAPYSGRTSMPVKL